MSHFEFLLMLRKYRLFYAIVFLLSSTVGGYFLVDYVLEYEGGSTFYLANESLVNPTVFGQPGQEDILQVSLVQERVYQLAYSTEMMTYLINRFDLYKHYNIDTTRDYHYERAVREINKKISFNKLTTDLSSIVVRDRNNEIAAAMANAAVWKLDQLNKKYLINKLQGNLNFYESFVKESEKVSKDQNQKLMGYMETLSNQRSVNSNSKSYYTPLSEIEFSLYEATGRIRDVTTQLLKSKSLYNNALISLQSKNLPSLVIVKKALPDLESKKLNLLVFAVLLGLVVLTLVILFMYGYFTYKSDLEIIFGSLPVPPKSNEQ
ncbi:MAG TPA: hypothetical protein PKD91_12010 [Bacteroidia bacterium]|mgnify:CR=1 FL=1|nr:hypothetical protein [Bacteroidia bacterium]